ncbi:hypothetical protein GMOD_00007414 [Pyrenophora seminiperda CCB06]|uniref:Uncharacterized protein n=1 Tax=Pyrenophora seminiperda CCB06 TaxID=1302712 RepID=A0A3M7MDE1_9PLEO|nr:hypothetical protein GMOD_00007414 [Pyrenophora seminiperda CCB06]
MHFSIMPTLTLALFGGLAAASCCKDGLGYCGYGLLNKGNYYGEIQTALERAGYPVDPDHFSSFVVWATAEMEDRGIATIAVDLLDVTLRTPVDLVFMNGGRVVLLCYLRYHPNVQIFFCGSCPPVLRLESHCRFVPLTSSRGNHLPSFLQILNSCPPRGKCIVIFSAANAFSSLSSLSPSVRLLRVSEIENSMSLSPCCEVVCA